MIVIGIDPGTRKMGYSILQKSERGVTLLDLGTIAPPTDAPLSERYGILFQSLCTLIHHFSPQEMAVETPFVYKNVQSALKLGGAMAAALIAAAHSQLPVFDYAPTQAKKAVVGIGQATKEQVAKMLQLLLQIDFTGSLLDATDATAIALCHLHRHDRIY